jgi:hypothetical protein
MDDRPEGAHMASATLRLTRQGAVGFELRRGTFHIWLDGNDVGSIEWHDTTEMPVEPGHHTLRIRSRRGSSLERSFDVADGGQVNFQCHGAMLWPRWAASLIVPTIAISLKRE